MSPFEARGLLLLAAALLAAPGAAAERVALARDPYLQLVTPDAVTVRWRTDVDTPSFLLWGPAPGQLDQALADPTLTTEHELRAEGLEPGTR